MKLTNEQVEALTKVYSTADKDRVLAAEIAAAASEVQHARKLLAFIVDFCELRAAHSKTAAHVVDIIKRRGDFTPVEEER